MQRCNSRYNRSRAGDSPVSPVRRSFFTTSSFGRKFPFLWPPQFSQSDRLSASERSGFDQSSRIGLGLASASNAAPDSTKQPFGQHADKVAVTAKHDSTLKRRLILLLSKRLPVLKLKARRKQGVNERSRCHSICRCTDNPVASCSVVVLDISDYVRRSRLFLLAFVLFGLFQSWV